MIKTAVIHQGNVHALVMLSDRIQYYCCPVGWFEQRRKDDKSIEVVMAWPPPYENVQPTTRSHDTAKGAETVKVNRL